MRQVPQRSANPIANVGNAVVGVLLLAIIVMLIIPLPTSVLDTLLVGNMAIAVALLVTALFASQPRQVTVFPTVLILGTLLRVGLGVATTRLILTQADAGTVVAAFGQAAAGGSVIIGLVVFAVIAIVQLLVVAKGAERVAEVSARFALDAMPGKQLAIDADVRSGALDSVGARQQRTQLEQDSQLMGAMDGAMRFVKGDAIAAIVIVVINLFGGLGIGMIGHQMTASSALQTYAVLSIGEGLLAQIPSLLSAIAAAILITRMATAATNSRGVASDLVAQVFGQPVVLLVTAGLLVLLAVTPSMPLLPFLLLAIVLSCAAWWLLRQRNATSVVWHRDSDLPSLDAAAPRFTLLVPTMQIMPRRAQQIDALRKIASNVLTTTGCTIHSIAWVWSPQATHPRLLVDASLLTTLPVAHVTTQLTKEASNALTTHAAEWISLDDTMHMLHSTRGAHQSLVAQVIPELCSLADLAELWRGLIRENVYLSDLAPLLTAIASSKQRGAAASKLDDGLGVAQMMEQIRHRLRRQITNHWAPFGALAVFTIDPMIEDAVRDSINAHGDATSLAIEPDIAMDIIAAVRAAHQRNNVDNASQRATVIMTSADVRRHFRSLLESELPQVVILAPHELMPGTSVTAVGQISLT